MGQNTHYHVLQDGKTNIALGGLSLDWNPSNDIVLNNKTLSPVLSFRADPSNNARNLKFKISLRNQTGSEKSVASFTYSGTVSRTIFEVLERKDITKDGMKFIFKKMEGDGGLDISDVIVWFHRNQ